MLAMTLKTRRTADRLVMTPTDDLAISAVLNVVVNIPEAFEWTGEFKCRRSCKKEDVVAKAETKQRGSMEM
jgi:hypothetical protein